MAQRIAVTGRRASKRCVVCHGDLEAETSTCEGCGAAFHVDCRPRGGCVTPGCSSAASRAGGAVGGAGAARPIDDWSGALNDLAAWIEDRTSRAATALAPRIMRWASRLLTVLAACFVVVVVAALRRAFASSLRGRLSSIRERLRQRPAARAGLAAPERREELPARLEALRVALAQADARREPVRSFELDDVLRRLDEVATELDAWDDPDVLQLFEEVQAAARRRAEAVASLDALLADMARASAHLAETRGDRGPR